MPEKEPLNGKSLEMNVAISRKKNDSSFQSDSEQKTCKLTVHYHKSLPSYTPTIFDLQLIAITIEIECEKENKFKPML